MRLQPMYKADFTRYLTAVGVTTLLALVTTGVQASTVAYWRFEDGPADADIDHIAVDGNTYSADVLDVSGNDNHLSTWITGGCCGYAYRSDVAVGTIASTEATNNFSVQNTGAGPGMFTGPTGIQTIAPAAFTVEASFRLENGGHRTIVGRDSTDVADINGELAALYFQALPGNGLAIKFADQDGFWHEASAPNDTINTWDPGSQTSADADWYHAAGVSDGSTLSLYLSNVTQGSGYQLVAQTDLTASGSTNTALTPGAGDGGDWDAGNWSVGRGLYNGGHGDRAYGFIDEVRISDHAVILNDLLHNASGQNLSIEVNTSTGVVTLSNNSTGVVTLDYYEITSDSGSLSETGWSSLDDQNIPVAPPGDYNSDGSVDAADYSVYRDGLGTTFTTDDYDVWAANYGIDAAGGSGWTEAGGSDANILSELLLDVAGASLAPGTSIPLGTAYNTGVDGQDLSFQYGNSPGTGLFIGEVTYVSSATAVPEPTTLVLLLGSLLGLGRRRSV